MLMPKHLPTSNSWRVLRTLVWVGLGGAAIAVMLPHLLPASLGSSNRLFLFISYVAFMGATFDVHTGLALVVTAIAAWQLRMRWAIACALLLIAFTLGPALWSLWPRTIEQAGTSPTLRVLSANLLVGHANVDRLLGVIRRENPDVILFQEYTAEKGEKLRAVLASEYPHVANAQRDDAFGQAVYSKLAFVGPSVLYPPAELGKDARTGGVVGLRDPQIRVAIKFAGYEVVLQDIHLVPPINIWHHHEQRQMAAWLEDWARSEPRPKIIAGDFNATPESTILHVLKDSGLHAAHAEAGRGRGVSWPFLGILRFAPGIRIDHILASGDLRCVRSEAAGFIDSDHEAIVAEYVWR